MTTKKLVIASGKVSGTHSNFPIYLKPSSMTGWTTLTTAEAESMRAYSDAGLTTELAIEVVSNDEIHIKVPSLSSSSEIYVTYDGIRSLYAFTDTYGRNAVWSGHLGVLHFETLTTDSTGARTISNLNSITTGTGKVGLGADGGTNTTKKAMYHSNNTPLGLSNAQIASSWSVSFWFYTTSKQSDRRYVNIEAINGSNQRRNLLWISDSTNAIFAIFDGSSVSDTVIASYSTNTWYQWVTTYDGSTVRHYVQAATSGTRSKGSWGNFTQVGRTGNFSTHLDYNNASPGNGMHGVLDEVRVTSSTLSANWITTEYNNQNDVATFWGTVTDAGGAPVANNGFMAFL